MNWNRHVSFGNAEALALKISINLNQYAAEYVKGDPVLKKAGDELGGFCISPTYCLLEFED